MRDRLSCSSRSLNWSSWVPATVALPMLAAAASQRRGVLALVSLARTRARSLFPSRACRGEPSAPIVMAPPWPPITRVRAVAVLPSLSCRVWSGRDSINKSPLACSTPARSTVIAPFRRVTPAAESMAKRPRPVATDIWASLPQRLSCTASRGALRVRSLPACTVTPPSSCSTWRLPLPLLASSTKAPLPLLKVALTPPKLRLPLRLRVPICTVVTVSANERAVLVLTARSPLIVPRPSTVIAPWLISRSVRARPSLNSRRWDGLVSPVVTVVSRARPNRLMARVPLAWSWTAGPKPCSWAWPLATRA